MTELPVATMEKLLKSAGAKRVSESAKKALQKALENKAKEVSEQAITFSKHAQRKTVKKQDIDLVLE